MSAWAIRSERLMVLNGNLRGRMVGTLALAANDADLRSWSKVALRSLRAGLVAFVEGTVERRVRLSAARVRRRRFVRFAWAALLDCSHGNVVNAIMIRRVPRATTST